MNSPTSPVLIVGAGPVGLTTALLLARQGIRSTVLQRGSDILRTGSRAIVLLRDTLEAFDAAAPGTGARLAARGITWRVKRTYHKDRLLFSETYPESKDARYPLFVNVSQQETDRALLDAARTQYPDHISVVFDQHVTGLRQTERHVVVVTEEGREFVADFVVGADGAHSNIRKLLGIELIGRRSENRFLIADVRAELNIDYERRFYYSPPGNPGYQAFMLPQPDGVWRFDWQVAPTTRLEDLTHGDGLHTKIRALIGPDIPYDVLWTSLYQFNNTHAKTFGAGRVFLAGDAAHQFSPFGGRGLNSGIGDARALGAHLARAIGDKTALYSLPGYNAERQKAAVANLDATGRVLRVLVPATPLHRAVRHLALRGARHFAFCRRYVDSGPYAVSQRPTTQIE